MVLRQQQVDPVNGGLDVGVEAVGPCDLNRRETAVTMKWSDIPVDSTLAAVTDATTLVVENRLDAAITIVLQLEVQVGGEHAFQPLADSIGIGAHDQVEITVPVDIFDVGESTLDVPGFAVAHAHVYDTLGDPIELGHSETIYITPTAGAYQLQGDLAYVNSIRDDKLNRPNMPPLDNEAVVAIIDGGLGLAPGAVALADGEDPVGLPIEGAAP